MKRIQKQSHLKSDNNYRLTYISITYQQSMRLKRHVMILFEDDGEDQLIKIGADNTTQQ